ncbi:autophagy protein 5 [Rhodosporidiobolus nylandii]
MTSRMRPQPSTASLAPSHISTSSAHAEQANATALAGVFRTLVFGGSVPIQVVIAEDELPPGADRSVEAFYIRKYFLDLVLDDNSAAALRSEDVWFEAEGGGVLKWHWPVGLLYDYYHASTHASLLPPPSSSLSAAGSTGTLPSSLAAVFAPLSSSSPAPSPNFSFPSSSAFSSPPPADSQSTLRARPRTPSSVRSGHSGSGLGGSGAVGEAAQPWRITLHLREPPMAELVVGNRVEDARTGFMAMVKEADYVRWGSTKRVTNLRKEQQDALWAGVMQNNFDKFWAVASRLIPLPSLAAPSSPSATRSPTPSSGGASTLDGRLPDANAVRNVPIRVFLPEGAPVMQELVAPSQADGTPTTLQQHLSALLPLLFPPSSPSSPLAHSLIQGLVPPLSTEVGWLGACMAGADGWVNIVVVLDEREEAAGGAHGRERTA